jgi:hypothetical protein
MGRTSLSLWCPPHSRNRIDWLRWSGGMSGKADFTPEEWELVLEGPTSAGMAVAAADRGGAIRESFSMAKAYSDARQQHGETELLDEVVEAKPKVDRTRHHSAAELKEHALRELRDAVELLERKATPEEVDEYKRFVLTVAERWPVHTRRAGSG